jgi:acetyl-CoA acyltransferase 2
LDLQAALEAAKVDPKDVDTVIVGNVIGMVNKGEDFVFPWHSSFSPKSSTDGPYLARHVALKCGMNISTPALVVNRLCGSGFQSIVSAVQDIAFGDASIAVAAGTESMSQAPFIARNMRFGTKLGTNYNLEDSLWASLTDDYTKTPMVFFLLILLGCHLVNSDSTGNHCRKLGEALQHYSQAM